MMSDHTFVLKLGSSQWPGASLRRFVSDGSRQILEKQDPSRMAASISELPSRSKLELFSCCIGMLHYIHFNLIRARQIKQLKLDR